MSRIITTLCGSTRFYEAFQRANYELTLAGHVVLSVGFYPHASLAHGEAIGCTPEQKEDLDLLHFDKIEMSHEIFVLNVGGYVGHSTRNEIAYAIARGKLIRWLEPSGGYGWLREWHADLGQRIVQLHYEGALREAVRK